MPSVTCLKLFFFLGLNWPKRRKYTTPHKNQKKKQTFETEGNTFTTSLPDNYSDLDLSDHLHLISVNTTVYEAAPFRQKNTYS